jgi:AcrR family transcriptional regulator
MTQGARGAPAPQRARIVRAVIEVVAERGFAGATVGLVVRRAGVSTRTFYEQFDDLTACLTSVVDLGFEQIEESIARELEREEYWLDGLRAGLAGMLAFFDREPAMARVCFVDALAAGREVVEHRERRVLAIATTVAAKLGAPDSEPPPFTLRSVVALVFGEIHAQLVLEQHGSMLELLGPLMGVIGGMRVYPAQAAREMQRGGEHARLRLAEREARSGPNGSTPLDGSSLEGIRVLRDRRARECLLLLYEQGERGIYPSNRMIGAAIGVRHKSQISMLLSRLHDEDLAVKCCVRPGGPNEWRLTPRGEELARALASEKR